MGIAKEIEGHRRRKSFPKDGKGGVGGPNTNPFKTMKPRTVRKKRVPMTRSEDLEKDSPSRDQNHDESRRNGYDPEVAKRMGLRPS
jgi:hypothetical protein